MNLKICTHTHTSHHITVSCAWETNVHTKLPTEILQVLQARGPPFCRSAGVDVVVVVNAGHVAVVEVVAAVVVVVAVAVAVVTW